jgi:hypothetical protein
MESIIRVRSAILGRLGNADANGPFEVAIVPKEQVALLYALDEPARPAERRMSSFVPKLTTALLVLLAGLRVRGQAHASVQFDPARFHLLLTERQNFLVLTHARLALDVEGTTERDVGVALINLRHVQFVARLDDEPAEPRESREHALVGS